MEEQAIDLIVAALQRITEKQNELSRDLNEWRQELSERTTKLEAAVKPALLGNGQPSELFQIKSRITMLEKAWWKVTVMAILAGGIVGAAVQILPRMLFN